MSDSLHAPIFIVGAPRTGTSILGRIMSSHPALSYSNEPRFVWRYGNDRKSDVLQADSLNANIEQHIRKHFSNVVESGTGKRLLEKHPSNSLRMQFVHKIFPDAQFVHIKRDGQGVSYERIDSGQNILVQRLGEMAARQLPFYSMEILQRLVPGELLGSPHWGPRLPGMKQLVKELPLLSICALQWRACVEMAATYGRKALRNDQYMEIELANLTENRLIQLLSDLQLEQSDEVLGFFRANFKSTPAKTKDELFSKGELELIDPHVNAVNSYLQAN